MRLRRTCLCMHMLIMLYVKSIFKHVPFLGHRVGLIISITQNTLAIYIKSTRYLSYEHTYGYIFNRLQKTRYCYVAV